MTFRRYICIWFNDSMKITFETAILVDTHFIMSNILFPREGKLINHKPTIVHYYRLSMAVCWQLPRLDRLNAQEHTVFCTNKYLRLTQSSLQSLLFSLLYSRRSSIILSYFLLAIEFCDIFSYSFSRKIRFRNAL